MNYYIYYEAIYEGIVRKDTILIPEKFLQPNSKEYKKFADSLWTLSKNIVQHGAQTMMLTYRETEESYALETVTGIFKIKTNIVSDATHEVNGADETY